MEENKDIKKAGEKLEEISSDETLRRLAELREKGRRDEAAIRESAIEEAKEIIEGAKEEVKKSKEEVKKSKEEVKKLKEEAIEEKRNSIKKLLKLGVEKEKIAEAFGITLKEVDKYL